MGHSATHARTLARKRRVALFGHGQRHHRWRGLDFCGAVATLGIGIGFGAVGGLVQRHRLVAARHGGLWHHIGRLFRRHGGLIVYRPSRTRVALGFGPLFHHRRRRGVGDGFGLFFHP